MDLSNLTVPDGWTLEELEGSRAWSGNVRMESANAYVVFKQESATGRWGVDRMQRDPEGDYPLAKVKMVFDESPWFSLQQAIIHTVELLTQ